MTPETSALLRAHTSTLLLAFLLVAACDGDVDGRTQGSTGESSAMSETGSASLTIEDNTYEFDQVRCAVGPDETGREDTEFVLSAIQDGLQLDATINTDFGHVVSLDDIEDFENPRVGWTAGGPGAGMSGTPDEIIRVDGRDVSVDAQFRDQLTGVTAEGALRATCP